MQLAPILKMSIQKLCSEFRLSKTITSLIPLINYIKSQKPKIMLSVLTSANIIAIFARIFSRTSFKLVISERAVTSLAVKDNKY